MQTYTHKNILASMDERTFPKWEQACGSRLFKPEFDYHIVITELFSAPHQLQLHILITKIEGV